MTLHRLHSSLPVLLIDTSYYVFYRYFSTVKWYQFRKKEIDYSTIHTDEAFMSAFRKHVLDDFKKLCKTWKTQLSQMVFCCDCSRENIWRNEFTDCYKQTRVPNPCFNPNIFFLFYQFLEENQEAWGVHKLHLDKLEADDIAYLTKTALQEKGWTQPIIIITNDNDYLQLLDSQTYLRNMNGKGNDLAIRSCGDPKKDLRLKLIMGDKSDNIVAIHPGIGPKTAMKLASMTEEELQTYLLEKGCKETFEKNQRLVDFQKIPQEYIDLFRNSFQWEFTA